MLPPNWPVQLKPAGSWNTVELEVQADSLRVSVNGKEVLLTDLGKLADQPGANPALKRRSGRIGFQSHTGTVRFRNIEIKELPGTAKMAAKTEPQAFVVLGGKGLAERKFDTLIEAVQGSSDGDTIEVRGNGPFVSRTVDVRHSLTIRAAGGFRPVIRLSPEATATSYLIDSRSQLVLEGLELWGTRLSAANDSSWTVIVCSESPLHIANCRLVRNGSNRCLQAGSRLTRLTNCELLAEDVDDLAFPCEDQARLTIDNCLLAGPLVTTQYCAVGIGGVNVQVTRSTLAARDPAFLLDLRTPPILPDKDRRSAAVALDVSRTVICVSRSVLELNQAVSQSRAPALHVEEADGFLRRFLQWRGEHNAYFFPRGFLTHSLDSKRGSANTIKDLDEWRRFWGSPESGSVQGSVKFQGGDLLARAASAPDQLTPEDFRLRPDSAGYRAGPDGKDLGADIDLVGPGPAYERWKRTPAYQQWLRDIGPLTSERTSAAGGQEEAVNSLPVAAGSVPATIWTDPEDRTLPPDFQIQGEYLGDVQKGGKLGCQVIALGDGAFRAVFLAGGLPGAGWDGMDKTLMDGKLVEDKAVFTPANDKTRDLARVPQAISATQAFPPQGQREYLATISGDLLTGKTDEGATFELKKVVRQSPTLGARPPDGGAGPVRRPEHGRLDRRPTRQGTRHPRRRRLAGRLQAVFQQLHAARRIHGPLPPAGADTGAETLGSGMSAIMKCKWSIPSAWTERIRTAAASTSRLPPRSTCVCRPWSGRPLTSSLPTPFARTRRRSRTLASPCSTTGSSSTTTWNSAARIRVLVAQPPKGPLARSCSSGASRLCTGISGSWRGEDASRAREPKNKPGCERPALTTTQGFPLLPPGEKVPEGRMRGRASACVHRPPHPNPLPVVSDFLGSIDFHRPRCG